ncbi:cell division protein FtsQ/DivIB [Evansella clarkii]|uniref:cell division protein FtsQ/DivIB n=1 Tax=Evansella clarkii TaxID=79879 RepID=UPI00099844E4|nr:FtsQ-type POTRA domain-containing protein [Evansella clarkii]
MNDKNIVELEERIPTLKERRRQRANRRMILYVSVFFLLMTLVAYFQSSFSHVRAVEVSGAQYVPEDWIVENSDLIPEVSMWRLNSEEVVSKLLSHPQIAEAELSRQWPNTVEIIVEEYDRVAYIKEKEEFFPLLETGELLTGDISLSVSPYDAPILVGFSDSELKEQMAEELSSVSDAMKNRISEIHLSPAENDPTRVIVYMNDGFTVHSTVRRFSERIAPYPSVVEQLEPGSEGIVHMRMNPYFESFETGEEEEGESEG